MDFFPKESLIAIGLLLLLLSAIWSILSIKKKDDDKVESPPLPEGDVLPILKSTDRLLINEICMLLQSNEIRYFVQNLDSSGIFPGPYILGMNDMVLFVAVRDVDRSAGLLRAFLEDSAMEIGTPPDEKFAGHLLSGEIISGGKGRTYLISPKREESV